MFNLPTSRNASEALRQAKCYEKAQAILKSRDYQTKTFSQWANGMNSYTVKTPYTTYLVSIRPNGIHSCTCPDYKQHQDLCKHIIACLIGEAQEQAQVAEGEAYAAMIAEGECSTGCDYPDHF